MRTITMQAVILEELFCVLAAFSLKKLSFLDGLCPISFIIYIPRPIYFYIKISFHVCIKILCVRIAGGDTEETRVAAVWPPHPWPVLVFTSRLHSGGRCIAVTVASRVLAHLPPLLVSVKSGFNKDNVFDIFKKAALTKYACQHLRIFYSGHNSTDSFLHRF